MRIRDWNTFITKHSHSLIMGAVVSSRLPPALMLDKNGKKLPTPYKLFCEWLNVSLVGTWSTVAVPLGFVIGVIDEADKMMVLAAYGPARHRGFKIGEKSVAVLNYADGNYATLATELGYKLNL